MRHGTEGGMPYAKPGANSHDQSRRTTNSSKGNRGKVTGTRLPRPRHAPEAWLEAAPIRQPNSPKCDPGREPAVTGTGRRVEHPDVRFPSFSTNPPAQRTAGTGTMYVLALFAILGSSGGPELAVRPFGWRSVRDRQRKALGAASCIGGRPRLCPHGIPRAADATSRRARAAITCASASVSRCSLTPTTP